MNVDFLTLITGCKGINVTSLKKKLSFFNTFIPISSKCYINTMWDNGISYDRGPECWGTKCPGVTEGRYRQTNRMGVFKDYYTENRFGYVDRYLPGLPADGEIEKAYLQNADVFEDQCANVRTIFGRVSYREFGQMTFSVNERKDYVVERGPNCAAKCFEKAGCNAWFRQNTYCGLIFGNLVGSKEVSSVSESGVLDGLCPTDAFRSEFTRKSRIICVIQAPELNLNEIIGDIVANNTGNPDNPLNQWSFTTRSENPIITASQYIKLDIEDYVDGRNRDSLYLRFKIDTHVRIGHSWSVGTPMLANGRKRRDESEMIPVEEITLANDKKMHDEAVEKTKETERLRTIMPRTDEILAEIEAIEEQATSFILDGGMELPSTIEVQATGPIETVEFVQKASDGSIAADCATGSCQCSKGFIDNGNGCEQMTEEQAATTQAPTTTQASTDAVEDFLQSLVDKIQSVFEDNRPDRPRTHLLAKWEKLRMKTNARYTRMQGNGCEFTNTWSDNNIDFDNVNTCVVSF